jgi:hypothetical protein
MFFNLNSFNMNETTERAGFMTVKVVDGKVVDLQINNFQKVLAICKPKDIVRRNQIGPRFDTFAGFNSTYHHRETGAKSGY